MIVATNDLELVCINYYFVYMKIDAGSKVKTARTWLCFQRPCASVVSGDVRVTMRITLLTRKCPAVRFALFKKANIGWEIAEEKSVIISYQVQGPGPGSYRTHSWLIIVIFSTQVTC